MALHAGPRQVLASTPFAFALELAVYAGGAGFVNFDAWLSDYCTRDSMTAIPHMLRYVVDKTSDLPGSAGGDGQSGVSVGAVDGRRSAPLNAESARAFLKVLQASAQGLPLEMLRELQVRGCSPSQVYLINLILCPGLDILLVMFGRIPRCFTKAHIVWTYFSRTPDPLVGPYGLPLKAGEASSLCHAYYVDCSCSFVWLTAVLCT